MIRYCTVCWAENRYQAEQCDRCGAPLAASDEADYVDSLITALHHPEASTPVRAALILGRIKDPRAIGPLRLLALNPPDPYIAAAAVEALAAFDGQEVSQTLELVVKEGGAPARRAASQALLRLRSRRQRS